MKICIITLPVHTNYGGILQAYALQLTLKRLGHEPTTLRLRRSVVKLPKWKVIPVYIKRIYKKFILNDATQILFFEKKINNEYSIINKHTEIFIKKNISIKEIDSYAEMRESDFDCYIVGSDQVWRPQYFRNDISNAYLAFTNNWKVKRLSYAPSFGTDSWEYSDSETKLCTSLINKFDAVSVREISGIRLCSEYLKHDSAMHVLDPTLLLSVNDYLKILTNFPDYQQKEEKVLLTYILDENPEKKKIIREISKNEALTPLSVISKQEVLGAPLEDRIALPVEEWLKGFKDAEVVFTDSFHACVFSILFHKPFFVYGNKTRGLSRFSSLLSIFDLKDRFIQSEQDYQLVKNNTIDWDKVDKKLNNYRNDSINFLSQNLDND